jgi:hypothetical protein
VSRQRRDLSTCREWPSPGSGIIVAMRMAARLVGFVLVPVIAGCTGGDRPPNTSSAATSNPTVTSSVPSVSPTTSSPYPADVPLTGHNVKAGEKPPLLPEAAQEKTQAGANAFGEFFMLTLDWAYATTNPSYMRHYFAPGCGLCNGIATGIHKTALNSHWYLGGRLTITSSETTRIAPVTAPADFCSVVTVSITATSVVDKTSKVFNGQGALVDQPFKLCEKFGANQWQITYLIGAA